METPCKHGAPDPSLAAAQALERAQRLRLEGLQPCAVRERVRLLRSAAAAHQADMSLPYAQALSSRRLSSSFHLLQRLP